MRNVTGILALAAGGGGGGGGGGPPPPPRPPPPPPPPPRPPAMPDIPMSDMARYAPSAFLANG
ncbi:hypothetical protein AB0V92_16875, partial [Mesorhizobium ciceri]|uniref:hypothetical protein n=1 Tax=Mesorhizobium ciceri TaxID=39645 RepID=UPI00344B00FB